MRQNMKSGSVRPRGAIASVLSAWFGKEDTAADQPLAGAAAPLHARRMDADAVYKRARNNPARKHPGRDSARFDGKLVFPTVTPGFQIEPGQKVFTIGSCFARNIEEELQRHGVDVPTMGFSTPRSEITETGRPNKALNQYNVGTMLQCVREIDGIAANGAFFEKGDMVVDALLSTGGAAVTPARAHERRAQIRALYASELPKSQVCVVTQGLSEAWYDEQAGLYLNIAPSRAMVKADKSRFSFARLDYDEVLHMTSQIVSLIQNAGCPHVLLTVSPVPLASTFTDQDCVVANATSKATLRTVAAAICEKMDGVDYYPSYEIVMSAGQDAFESDLRHVKPAVVSQVVDHMLSAYMPRRNHTAAAVKTQA